MAELDCVLLTFVFRVTCWGTENYCDGDLVTLTLTWTMTLIENVRVSVNLVTAIGSEIGIGTWIASWLYSCRHFHCQIVVSVAEWENATLTWSDCPFPNQTFGAWEAWGNVTLTWIWT